MNFVQNILWNSVEGFVEAGTRTAGGYAGDALIKAGDLIENSGRSVGTGIERRASNYGSSITGQSYQPSAKALPSTARRPVAKRSNSLPASTKAVGPTSKVPLGANKYPGGKTAGTTKQKQITNTASSAKSSVGGAQKAIGGSVGAVKNNTKALPKAYPNNVPYGTSKTPQSIKASAKPPSSLTAAKGVAENKKDNLPKPYSSSPYPTEKKSAVRPGQIKPFTPPVNQNQNQNKSGVGAGDKKKQPYPGTNTIPGQGSKVPVTQQKYKPMPRLEAPAERGKMQHISV